MAYQQRRGRGGNQRAPHTRTPPPPPPPPFNGPYYEPSVRGRGGNQRPEYTRTPPPPFTGPHSAPYARGLVGYQRDVAAGVVLGAVGAAAIMYDYDVPAYGRYPNLPPTTGFVATGIELATEVYEYYDEEQ